MRGHKWGGRLAFIFCLTLAATYVATPAQALAKVKCDLNGGPVVVTDQDDPVKAHNQPEGTAEHEHWWFASTLPATIANPNTIVGADLLGSGTTCRDPGDTSAYIIPTFRLKSTGEQVKVQQATFYYRSGSGANQGPAVQPPTGLALVSRDYNMTCGTKSGARSAPILQFPDCRGLSGKPGLTTTVHVTFPSCMKPGYVPDHPADAVGDVSDNAAVVFPVGKKCPVGFETPIPQLKETFQLAYTGDPADLVLSSDAVEGGTNGTSMHADWVNGWDPTAFQTVIDQCITSSKAAAAKVCDR